MSAPGGITVPLVGRIARGATISLAAQVGPVARIIMQMNNRKAIFIVKTLRMMWWMVFFPGSLSSPTIGFTVGSMGGI
jgi:hypothetical protein